MIKSARAVTTCSRELFSSDVHAEEISISETDGVRYRMRTPDGEYDVQCRIPAQFTVMNSMQALLAVHRVGIDLEDACDALAEMPGVRGRMEHLPIPESLGFFTIIDYAHTPDALEKLLQSVRKTYANHRIVLLFGCGGDRDRLKRPMMGRIASAYADAIAKPIP
jgi:UDP-N-acetylmuramoyl-L-alanyl-D-glutamate--2,6-diaminopimelate ligase